MINFTGLASGLDTRAMIDAILNAERRPVERLTQRSSLFSARKAGLDELRSKLNDFKNSLRDLSSSRKFRGRTTSVSDDSILRASAGSAAETGLFQIDVNALAAAHKVKSDGFSASDQGLISDGQITLQSGSEDLITIDVSAAAGNNTLAAVRKAINDADLGVRASVLFDGTEHRLIVRSEETGTTNALTINDSTNLNLGAVGNEVSAAADAQVVIDGINITSSSNKLTTAIEGVTLDLLTTTAGSSVNVEIAQDNDGVVEGVQQAIGKYNELIDFFNAQNNRDNPGVLAGDPTARQAQRRLQSLFTGGVAGIPFGGIRSLSSLGVDFDGKTGRASLDSAELRDLLETRFEEVGDLFLSSAATTEAGVSFVSTSATTTPGEYDVEITQAAEQATLVGSTAISSLKKDEDLTITVGGDSVVVNLLKNDTITDVVDAVNAALLGAGIEASATDDNGKLSISTDAFGSAASITVESSLNDPGDGKQSGFDTTPANDDGLDVAGKIGGVDATGVGRTLTGATGSPSEGLQLLVTATAATVAGNGGDFGQVAFTKGFIDNLVGRIEHYTRLGDGILESATDSLNVRVKQFNDDITRIEERLTRREAQLIRAFGAAENAIAALQSQQSSLSSFRLL